MYVKWGGGLGAVSAVDNIERENGLFASGAIDLACVT